MEPRFLSANDVSMRLNHSVVKYKGTFMYCQACGDGELYISLTSLSPKRGKEVKVNANDENLDFSSPELGYANLLYGYDNEPVACFISRVPYRRQKQCIANDNLICHKHTDKDYTGVSRESICSVAFENMLNNVYEDVETVLKKLKDIPSYAFSRDFAFKKEKDEIKLLYRNERCGVYDEKNNRITLFFEYDNSIFRYKLEERGLKIAG